MSEIRITKISVSDSAKKEFPVNINYERDTEGGDVEEIKHPGSGLPHPDFVSAMDGFVDMAIAICRLNDEEWGKAAICGDAHITGLTIKQDGGPAGVNIAMVGKFQEEDESHVAVVVNTPYIPYERFSNSDITALDRVLREAEFYIAGKRAQGSLFDQVEEAIAA